MLGTLIAGDDGRDANRPDRAGRQRHEARRQQLRRRRHHQGVGQGCRARRGQSLRPRDVVDIKPGEQTLTVRSRSVRGGPPRSLDYAITRAVVDADRRQRHVCRRHAGRRRRRRQRRDDARRHQGARRLGLRLAEVGAGRDHAGEGQRADRSARASTRASIWRTSAAISRPSRPTAASSSTGSTPRTSTSTPSTATSPTTARSRTRASIA